MSKVVAMEAHVHQPITLARDVRLPADAVTQTFAILGRRGSGKTTTAKVLVEELLELQHQVVMLDPLDVAWGLRSSRDGARDGYAITVLGGEHADLPLEATAGTVIAEFVVDTGASVILSLRHFSLADQRRFVTDFCERLYALKGKAAHRTPLHLVIDECDEFAHQRIPHGFERLFGAIDRLVRRGRASGIGVTLISQRPAVVHKDVLSQAEVLICHQTIGPQDRKALETWIEAHDAHGQRQTFMESLAGLGRGEAWVWSPGWLDIFVKAQIRAPRTFDSSATPKAGEQAATPRRVADVDLEQLRLRIADTIERAKADDPKELRRQVAELRRQLETAQRQAMPEIAAPVVERVEVPVLTEAMRADWMAAVDQARVAAEQAMASLVAPAARIEAALRAVMAADQPPARRSIVAPRLAPSPTPVVSHVRPRLASTSEEKLGKGERSILTALAQYPAGRTKVQVAILTGYAHNGGGFNNYLSALRKRELLEGSGDSLRLTDAGADALGDFDPLPTGRALLEHWLRQVGKAERSILDVLADVAPRALTKADLGARAGYEPNGGGFNNALSRLRTLELIEGRGDIRLSEDLR